MGRLTVIALVVAGVLAGVGGTLLLGGEDDDRTIPAVVAPAAAGAPAAARAPEVVIDDGVPAREAEALAERAARHVGGQALTVDTDDGLFEVEVQRPDGAIVEVLLGTDGVVAVQQGDGD